MTSEPALRTTPPGDAQIDTLEAKGLIRLATLRPELEYLFRHSLVQDAAYGSLLKQERRVLHGRVAEALEQLYPERRDELAPVLAMHFEQAGDTDKAIDYLATGGKQALKRNAIQEAYAAFDQAKSLVELGQEPPASAEEARRRRKRQIEIEIGRAEAGYSFRSPEEAFEALERVAPEADALGDPELIIHVNMLIALGRLQNGDAADTPEVKRALDRMIEIGEQIGDRSLRSVPMVLIGMTKVFTGAIREGLAMLEEALPVIGSHQDTIGAAFARGALAIGYATLGEFDKAEAASAQATEIASRGDLIAQLDALIARSFVQSMRGDLASAVPLAEECVGKALETGATACMVVSSWILGDAFLRQGRFAEAHDVLKVGADISAIADRKVWRPTLLAWFGRASAALGGTEDSWDEALDTARSIDNRFGEAMILAKRAESAAVRGDIDGARPDAEAAIALMDELGARPYLARALNAWGIALRNAGRTEEADPLLRRAAGLFDELGIEAEAAAIRTLLSLGETRLAFN